MTALTEGYLLRPGVVLDPGLFIFGAEFRTAQLHPLRPPSQGPHFLFYRAAFGIESANSCGVVHSDVSHAREFHQGYSPNVPGYA